MLDLFTIFHLNLAYSSIPEEARPEVVRRCYWPLLNLAQDLEIPLGIEAPGYTLEAAAQADPAWIEALRRLIASDQVEFVGSGFAQIIGPLVPAQVNAANLRLGLEVYQRLLGIRPKLALINEQAYSAGLVALYLQAGYEALVMEWDNPARGHPEWRPEWRYLPQLALGPAGESLPLIWNASIPFQKVQRYAHGEMSLDEVTEYLSGHLPQAGRRALAMYGNDAEIFDFRPGRYDTEEDLQAESEWGRLGRLFQALRADGRFRLVKPSQVLDLLGEPGAGQGLRLESAGQPIPVKKQAKYNVTRWAVTGRDDLSINTACHRIHQALGRRNPGRDSAWQELCYLWSSDFRTHVTEKRWQTFLERLGRMEKGLGLAATASEEMKNRESWSESPPPGIRLERQGRFLELETPSLLIRLNCRRGLAVEALVFKEVSPMPLLGTLPHGFFDDIGLGVDFYTGHLILESPGRPKVTDLNPVTPEVLWSGDGEWAVIEAQVSTPLGPVIKSLRLGLRRPEVRLTYSLRWPEPPLGSLRLGFITLNPRAFDRESLYYSTHNGGRDREIFPLAGQAVDHGQAVSFLVSARQGLGLTEGRAELGDRDKKVSLEIDRREAAAMGLLTYQEVGDSFFCRLAFSLAEMDETSRPGSREPGREISFYIRVTAEKEK